MYGIGALRSRFKLCRLAMCMCRSSPLFANSEKAIIDVADKYGPNLGFCTNPTSNVVNVISNPQLTTNPNLEPSYKPPAGSDVSSAQEEDKRIWAVERLGKGKQYTGHDRKQDRIPSYVVDLTMPELEHVLVVLDKFQIESLCTQMGKDKFLITVFTLEVYDGLGSQNILYKLPVLPRRINQDKSGHICNIGFIKALPGVKMKLDTPIRICGQEDCIGVKKGGYLKVHLKYVSLYCSAEELHPFLIIDVTMMDIGDKICLRELEVPLHSSIESSSVICEVVNVQSGELCDGS